MPFDFPNLPTLNQTAVAPNGATFVWDGVKWTTAENAVMNPGAGLYLPLSGSSPMIGPLTLAANATQPMHAVPLQQVNLAAIDVINVKNPAYGAKGDGVTDDTAALNAAAAAIPATGGAVYLPKGRYSVSGTLFLKSLTRLMGDGWGSVIAANAAWHTNTTLQLVLNQNYMATTITDHDIVVENLAFDYTNMPAGLSGSTNGGFHCVSCRMARNVQVRNCRFEAGTIGNGATAMVACDTTLVESCVAYNMVNCAYDHWWNAQNAKVLTCYHRGPCAGMLFNPDPTVGSSAGLAANNFHAIGNTFINTSAGILACQLEPLNPGCTVSNVTVADNIFSNLEVIARGAVTGLVITGNTFIAMSDGNAIGSWTANGGTPSGVVVTNNVVVNPSTSGPAQITVLVDGAIVSGNQITGTAYGAAPGIDTSTNAVVVIGNSVSNGTINAPAAVAGTGNVTVRNGASFAWKDASGSPVTWAIGSDNHMTWYGTGASGSQRLIMDMYQRSSTSSITWSVPVAYAGTVGFNGTAPIAKPTVSGAKGSNAALASLIAALANYGLITDTTTT